MSESGELHPGEVLRDALKRNEVTAAELARRIGCPRSSLSRVMRGHCTMSTRLAVKVEDALGVPRLGLTLVLTGARYQYLEVLAEQLDREVES